MSNALKAPNFVVDAPPPPEGAASAAESYEDPEWRLNWFLFQRTFPYDTLPSQGRFNAYSETISVSTATPQATPPPVTDRWRPIGSSPIIPHYQTMGVTSGRLSAIAISPADPRLILVGSATGGIWRSVDGGDTFVSVSDDQVDLAVGSLAICGWRRLGYET